jgi:tetratricopeptide (TPR) repeat protein
MIPVSQRFKESDKMLDRADALLKQGEHQAAAQVLEEITTRFPEVAEAWCKLGELVLGRLRDPEGSLEFFRKAIECDASFAAAYLAYAEALFRLERYAEVNALLNQVLAMKGVPKDQAIFKSGILLESQGRYHEAVEAYQKSILSSYSNDAILESEKGIERCHIKKKYSV